ncbi:bicaudal-D-related protein 2-like [Pholidichthys leucotaenia]
MSCPSEDAHCSVLNERLRPRFTTTQQLYSSLNRLEGRQFSSLRTRTTSYPIRPTVLPVEPQPTVTGTISEPQTPDSDELEEGSCADLLTSDNAILISEMSLRDEEEEDLGDNSSNSSTSQSEEKDGTGELTSEGTGGSAESGASASGETSSFQRNYMDGTLPDLLKSGRPLGRRRTLGHVSDTLKEVRREVELSRRRSIKLKAQVDKLEESRDGPVTEEILFVLRLLQPLTEPESSMPHDSDSKLRLDAALAQLKNVAQKLAVSHTKQEGKPGKKGEDDRAILQQALRDRDEAIEKKKAMEAELLRSKTELMMLNNQLLEGAQKRLELSLEVEAWKEDFQLLLQQQVQHQQRAEQKKSSRIGILRRSNKPQRPASFPLSPATHPATPSGHVSRPAAPAAAKASTPPSISKHSNWMEKLRANRSNRELQDSGPGADDDGFQVVSLD